MGQGLMRTQIAKLLRSMAVKVEPPFTFSPDVMAAIQRHNLRADELGPGVEVGYRWAEQLTTGANSVIINHSLYSKLGLPETLSTKVTLDRWGRVLSAQPQEPRPDHPEDGQ
jgi:hypothetical protein